MESPIAPHTPSQPAVRLYMRPTSVAVGLSKGDGQERIYLFGANFAVGQLGGTVDICEAAVISLGHLATAGLWPIKGKVHEKSPDQAVEGYQLIAQFGATQDGIARAEAFITKKASRWSYALSYRNCMTFARCVTSKAGCKTPWILFDNPGTWFKRASKQLDTGRPVLKAARIVPIPQPLPAGAA